MELQLFELGTMVIDKVTKTKGMLTMFEIDMSSNQLYLFQPSMLNPETQQPVETLWIDEKRIQGGRKKTMKLPMEVLGTLVEDKATTFKGTAVNLLLHLNGCIHVVVKPEGKIKKTNESIASNNFDLRRLKGNAIRELSKKELEKSKKKEPGPERYVPHHKN